MQRVIVTGANGFIGRYVTERLLESDSFVCAIDRRKHGWKNDDICEIISELSSKNAVDQCKNIINKADVMVHLAADITVPGNSFTIGNNIDGMIAALEIAKHCKVQHFILLSSIPVIGNILYTPIDEAHRVIPKTPYHWSKYLCEQMLMSYKDFCRTLTVMRIPSPIGVGMRSDAFLNMLLQRMRNNKDVEVYGKGKRIQNYIDVRDIAYAITLVIKEQSDGLFLIAGRKSISNRELVEMCKRITMSESNIVEGKHEDKEENERWIVSSEKAMKELGFEPQYCTEDSIRWICGEVDG